MTLINRVIKKRIQDTIDSFILGHKIEGEKEFIYTFYNGDRLSSYSTWILEQDNMKPSYAPPPTIEINLTKKNEIFIRINKEYGYFKNYDVLSNEELCSFKMFDYRYGVKIFVYLDNLMKVMLIIMR